MLGIGKWRVGQLLMAWSAYWAGLILVTLGPAALAAWKVIGPREHGSISAGFGDGAFTLDILKDGAAIWHGSASVMTTVLWLAGPPLLLWVVWMITRPSRREVGPGEAARQLEESRVESAPVASRGDRITPGEPER
jgi:hypothetical protein